MEKKDIADVLQLCRQHAAYEGQCYLLKNQESDLVKFIFSEPARLYCWVVENIDGSLIGYCTYMTEFSTWKAGPFVHMDCLYLVEEARNRGIGKKLVTVMVEHVRSLGIDEIQWQTPEGNSNAIRFYERLGASAKKKVRFFLDPLNYQP